MTVTQAIVESIARLNDERVGLPPIPTNPETPLYGADSLVDSLGLITILMDVEEAFGISVTDDAAIGETPWRTIASLTEFVEGKL
jgi:acyl carrier protein